MKMSCECVFHISYQMKNNESPQVYLHKFHISVTLIIVGRNLKDALIFFIPTFANLGFTFDLKFVNLTCLFWIYLYLPVR